MSKKKWYILQVVSGFESKLKLAMENKIKSTQLTEFFGDVMIPSQSFVEIRDGKKHETKRSFFPGYVLINMEGNQDTWSLIKSIDRVINFLGDKSGKPIPLTAKEYERIVSQIEDGVAKPKPKIAYEIGEKVRILEGPFKEFDGLVEEVSYDKNKLRVSVFIFNRATPVYLDFSEVEKEQ